MSISEKKFNKILTGILVVVVSGIVVVGAVFGRSIVEKIIQNKEAQNAVNEFDQRDNQILQMKQKILHLIQVYLQIVQKINHQEMELALSNYIMDMLLLEKLKFLKLN